MEESKKITHKNLGQTQIFKKREEVDEEVNSDGNTYKTKKINDPEEDNSSDEEESSDLYRYSRDMASKFNAPSKKMIIEMDFQNKEAIADYFIKIRKKNKGKSELYAKAFKRLIEKYGIIGVIHTKIRKSDITKLPHKCSALIMAICSMLVLNESTEKRNALYEHKSHKTINDSNPFKFLAGCKIRRDLFKAELNNISNEILAQHLSLLKQWVCEANDEDDFDSDGLSDINEVLYSPWSRKIINVMSSIATIMKITIELINLDEVNKLSQHDSLITTIKGGDRGTVAFGFNHYNNSKCSFVRFNIFFNKEQFVSSAKLYSNDEDDNDEDIQEVITKFQLTKAGERKISKIFTYLHDECKYEIKYLKAFKYSYNDYFKEREKEMRDREKIFIENAINQISNAEKPLNIVKNKSRLASPENDDDLSIRGRMETQYRNINPRMVEQSYIRPPLFNAVPIPLSNLLNPRNIFLAERPLLVSARRNTGRR